MILDPNTADPRLIFSDDLTSVRRTKTCEPLPDNPERFDTYGCLGSEGFTSGTHRWDVDVKNSLFWSLGVTTASNQRKGRDFFKTDVWSVVHNWSKGFGFTLNQKLERVRVDLDYDRGTVSFSDPVNNKHLHTYTTTFTDSVYPVFGSFSTLKIFPSSNQ